MFSALKALRSLESGEEVDDLAHPFTCPKTGGALEGLYDLDWIRSNVDRDAIARQPRGIWRWSVLLPVRDPENVVTLREGDTPLIHAERLGADLGLRRLFILDESRNPTGSFKDRGGSVTVSKCREVGVKEIVLASSGNAAACFSAYCARGGLEFTGFVRDDSSQVHCLQVGAYGALTLIVEGDLRAGVKLAEEVSKSEGALHATLPRNLYRIEGKKTAAYEIAEALGWKAPDRVVCPTAGGTMSLAMEQGFRELRELGWIDTVPKIDIVQADGCAPIVRALRTGGKVESWGAPHSKSAGLTSPFPAAGDRVAEVVRKTGGEGIQVTDEMNLEAEFLIARREGLFLQPAAAAAVAGLMPGAERETRPGADETIVCIGTGTGKNAAEVAGEALGRAERIPGRLEDFLAARERWRARRG
ncbi:MAG: threonine synthase [bacterium]